MIAFVSGRVAALAPDGAVVEVGGVGLTVQCTPGTLAALRIGEQAHLPTSLVVREESLRDRFATAHPTVPTAVVPALAGDVHDLEGLRRVGDLLAGDVPA